MSLTQAKLEAKAVNEKQWINPPAPPVASAPPAAAAPKSSGTQAPPPAMLQLPKAKLEAAAVNEKQWINPPPAAAVPAKTTITPEDISRSDTEGRNMRMAIAKLKEDLAAAEEQGAAALPKAIETQAAISDITAAFTRKLNDLSSSATSKLVAS